MKNVKRVAKKPGVWVVEVRIVHPLSEWRPVFSHHNRTIALNWQDVERAKFAPLWRYRVTRYDSTRQGK